MRSQNKQLPLGIAVGRTTLMNSRISFATSALACICFLGAASLASAQQKPQWMPGQVGLNAGILPSPGFTYVNIDENYDAGTFNGPKGNAIPVTGTYNVWAIENLFYFVPDTKFLDGNLGFDIMFPTPATGSLVADINVQGVPNLGAAGGGSGLADLWVQPFTECQQARFWYLKGMLQRTVNLEVESDKIKVQDFLGERL